MSEPALNPTLNPRLALACVQISVFVWFVLVLAGRPNLPVLKMSLGRLHFQYTYVAN